MPNKNIFCNVPWTNTHVYWDGSYGVCCSERHKPHSDNDTYNTKNMSVVEWYNSDVMNGIREKIKGNEPLSQCAGCYREEAHGSESRRIKENFKSVIFTEQAFDRSYKQSPWYDKFESTGVHIDAPIDWHVDLGNECNLSCKMCNPNASSQIAMQYKKWKIYDGNIQNNWTLDDSAWGQFLSDIGSIPKLNRVHFMGGEPTMSKRFVEFLQHMIDIGKTNVSISFVTNGTKINQELLDLLAHFKTYDIEVSIESIYDNNHYIRQGSVTRSVIDNILHLKSLQSDQFHLVLRTAPQLLSVNNYDEFIKWAVNHNLPIQSIPLINPPHYQICVLPQNIKETLIPKYEQLLLWLGERNTEPVGLATGRLVSAIPMQMIRETNSILSMLRSPEPSNVEQLRFDLVKHMTRWDMVHGYDALKFYPEYADFFSQYGY